MTVAVLGFLGGRAIAGQEFVLNPAPGTTPTTSRNVFVAGLPFFNPIVAGTGEIQSGFMKGDISGVSLDTLPTGPIAGNLTTSSSTLFVISCGPTD